MIQSEKMSFEKTPALYTAKFPFDEDDAKKKNVCTKTLLSCILAAVLIGLCVALTVQFLYPVRRRYVADIDEDHYFEGQELDINAMPPRNADKAPWHLDFLINPTRLCETVNPPESEAYQKNPEVKFLILVHSATAHFAQRKAIRNSWGSVAQDPRGTLRLGFVLGTTPNATESDLIDRESVAFADIIQADFEDNYRNLTSKSVLMLKWVSRHCAHAQYFLKADDDTFVNLHAIANILQKDPYQTGERFIGGFIHKGARPLRNPNEKYYVSEDDYPRADYPPYVSGSAYLSTGKTAAQLFEASKNASPIVPMEDIFVTGVCADDIDATLLHEPSFLYKDPPRPVSWDSYSSYATAHSVTPDEIEQIWSEMVNTVFDAMDLSDFMSLPSVGSSSLSSDFSADFFFFPGRNTGLLDSLDDSEFFNWPDLDIFSDSPIGSQMDGSKQKLFPGGLFRLPETEEFNLTFFLRK